MELSKKEKQEIRKIIESGLQREFANGLSEADNILTSWKNKSKSNRDVYHQLYKHIMDFDKHISRRYDRISGSKYLFIIAGQLIDGVIIENDLSNLSKEVQQAIKMIANI
ncbi:MAG: hypothetical protein NTV31_03665 [Bacteroidia bacterium]|nr:hypothetical protein [Bacteroidia bacterium]